MTFNTDHQPLATMKSLKEPMGRIGRLLNKIQDQEYTIVYQPGVKNVTADLLSRPETESKSVDVNACGLVFKNTVNWSEEQKSDELVGKILDLVSNGNFTDANIMELWSKEKFCSFLIKNKDNFVIKDNVLVYNDNERSKTVVPSKIKNLVLEIFHDCPVSGHRDFEKSYDLIKPRYYRFNIRQKV